MELVNAFLLRCTCASRFKQEKMQQSDAKECTVRPNHSTKKRAICTIYSITCTKAILHTGIKKMYIFDKM